jgi:hypothetical protein
MLEHNEPKKAREHFREALRLNPENEWARQGIVEALKARNIIYALMLRYFLAMSKLSRQAQWGIIVAGYFGNRILGAIARNNPNLAPYILPIQILYVCFAVLTWMASPLFNLMLRVNRFGRLALSREQTVASNWIGSCLLLALLALAGWFLAGFKGPWLLVALVFGLLLLPLAGTFKCYPGWPRNVMAGYTGFMALTGIAAITLFALASLGPREQAHQLADVGGNSLTLFLIGAIASTWVANFLGMQRPKR